jgi:hypothetical protein
MTVHTSCWRQWAFPCIMSQLLTIVTHDWSSATSKASSGSSSSSIAYSVPSLHVIWWCLVVLRGIILGLRGLYCGCVLLYGCSVVLLLCSIVWSWGLIELGHCLPSHHFGLYPVGIQCSFPHQLHSSAIFSSWPTGLTKSAIRILGNCLVLLHHRAVIRVVTQFLAYFAP